MRGDATHPLVAIPANHLRAGRVSGWAFGGFAVPEGYVRALRRAGVWPVIVPEPAPEEPKEVLEPFGGLLLAGGGDIDPRRYGAEPHPSVYGVDPDRDALELDLAGAALALGLPVLGVCRGFQVLNVACGGSLHQHLPDLLPGDAHGDPTHGRSAWHEVQVQPGSRAAEAVGDTVLPACLSHHHQGVDRLGEGLVPVGWGPDGLIEAIEAADPDRWVVGVQWHPELTAPEDPLQQRLFDGFAAAVRRHALA